MRANAGVDPHQGTHSPLGQKGVHEMMNTVLRARSAAVGEAITKGAQPGLGVRQGFPKESAQEPRLRDKQDMPGKERRWRWK